MKIFVTSDTHFNHKNIIEFCERPFSDVQEMNEKMIENWNKVVCKDDLVFHLGDFQMGDRKLIPETLKRLNGIIFLIRGNHDTKPSYFPLKADHLVLHLPMIASWKTISVIKKIANFFSGIFGDEIETEEEQLVAEGKSNKILLVHSPYEKICQEESFSMVLHGHVHEKWFVRNPGETVPSYEKKDHKTRDEEHSAKNILVNAGVDNGLKRFAPIELKELLLMIDPDLYWDHDSSENIFLEFDDGKIFSLHRFVNDAKGLLK